MVMGNFQDRYLCTMAKSSIFENTRKFAHFALILREVSLSTEEAMVVGAGPAFTTS